MGIPAAEVRDPQTYAIIGAAMEVHGILRSGFLESVYHEALKVEMQLRNIPFTSEVAQPIIYKGMTLPCSYRADLLAFGQIIVELKAVREITDIERAQVLNYLRATGFYRALLINFGASSLEYERIVLNYEPDRAQCDAAK